MKGFDKTQPKKKKRLTLEEARRLSPDERKKTAHVSQHESHGMYVQSQMNSRDQKPMVSFQWGKERTQLTPSEALDHALGVIQAAIAAETDSLLFEFITRVIGGEANTGVFIVLAFRKFREDNPTRFKAWRGQAMDILKAAETTEVDEFLREFLTKISAKEGSGEDGDEREIDVEGTLVEFQELRELRRLSVAVRQ